MSRTLFLIYKKLIIIAVNLHLEKIPFLVSLHRLIYKAVKPKSVEVFAMKLFINPKDKILSDTIIRDRIWEPQETKFITSFIKKGWTILDIGANIGYFTLLFSKLAGKRGKVFAFEPDLENFTLLEQNVNENKLKNIVLVKKAVSNTTGKIKLFLDEENKGDHKIYNSYDGRKSITIESIRLDDYFKDYKGKIDFIKMDIQGAEGLAAAGMLDLLKKQKNITIISEYWPHGLHKAGVNPPNYLKLLKKNNFRLLQLHESTGSVTPLNENKLYKDCTIENKKYTNLICIK